MSETVSVIIPMTPNAVWLAETCSSLVQQTHRDWELIAALDGECDVNRAVLSRIDLLGRVKVVALPRGSGVSRALNAGLEVASASLIARLDADDVCEPQRLEAQVHEMRARPNLQVLGSTALEIDESGRVLRLRRVPVGSRLVTRTLRWRNALIHPSVMFRREAVSKIGGYNVSFKRGQDYELWLRIAAEGELDNLPEPLLRYRIHTGQHSRPLVGSVETSAVRNARRGAGSGTPIGKAAADFRHAAWLTHQHIQSGRLALKGAKGPQCNLPPRS